MDSPQEFCGNRASDRSFCSEIAAVFRSVAAHAILSRRSRTRHAFDLDSIGMIQETATAKAPWPQAQRTAANRSTRPRKNHERLLTSGIVRYEPQSEEEKSLWEEVSKTAKLPSLRQQARSRSFIQNMASNCTLQRRMASPTRKPIPHYVR